MQTVKPHAAMMSMSNSEDTASRLIDMSSSVMTIEPSKACLSAIQTVQDATNLNDVTNLISEWFEARHQWYIDPAEIVFASDITQGISAVVRTVANVGQKVIVCTPMSNVLLKAVFDAEVSIIESRLLKRKDQYELPWDELIEQIADPDVVALVITNPHTPTGRAWLWDELRTLTKLCARHGVTVISGEAWGELVYAPHQYSPMMLAANHTKCNCVAVMPASKTFALSMCQDVGWITTNQKTLLPRIHEQLEKQGLTDVSSMNLNVIQAAYRDADDWTDDLREVWRGNDDLFRARIKQTIGLIRLYPLQAGFLQWVDCRFLDMDDVEIVDSLLMHEQLLVYAGSRMGEGGVGFIRINLGMNRETMLAGCERLISGITRLARDRAQRKALEKQAEA